MFLRNWSGGDLCKFRTLILFKFWENHLPKPVHFCWISRCTNGQKILWKVLSTNLEVTSMRMYISRVGRPPDNLSAFLRLVNPDLIIPGLFKPLHCLKATKRILCRYLEFSIVKCLLSLIQTQAEIANFSSNCCWCVTHGWIRRRIFAKSSWYYFEVSGRRGALYSFNCEVASNMKTSVNLLGGNNFCLYFSKAYFHVWLSDQRNGMMAQVPKVPSWIEFYLRLHISGHYFNRKHTKYLMW